MRDTVIVGAGGFGREVLDYLLDVRQSLDSAIRFNIKGFLDDNPNSLVNHDLGHDIIGSTV